MGFKGCNSHYDDFGGGTLTASVAASLESGGGILGVGKAASLKPGWRHPWSRGSSTFGVGEAASLEPGQ